jgi:hypothetical protein
MGLHLFDCLILLLVVTGTRVGPFLLFLQLMASVGIEALANKDAYVASPMLMSQLFRRIGIMGTCLALI